MRNKNKIKIANMLYISDFFVVSKSMLREISVLMVLLEKNLKICYIYKNGIEFHFCKNRKTIWTILEGKLKMI